MKMQLRESDYENYDYREFWDKGKRAYEDRSERMAIRRLFKGIDKKGKIFLDLGCGYGRLFDEYSDFSHIILIDYSLKNLKIAKGRIKEYLQKNTEKPGSVYLIAADATSVPLEESSIDTVLTVRVLHHIGDPQKYFDEVKRILKKGCCHYLEFANKRNIKNILRYFFKRLDVSPFDEIPLKVGDTILNFHPKYISGLIEERGFRVLKRISVSNFRAGFLKKILGLWILNKFESFYQIVTPWMLFGPSIFLKNLLIEGAGGKEKPSSSFDIYSILRCPACQNTGLADYGSHKLICNRCKKQYGLDDGIMDLRL